MNPEITLCEVQECHLPVFFEQQLDPEAIRMAAFPSREREAFMAHWAKCMTNETTVLRTIVFEGEVAGNIVFWEDPGEPKIGYWLGRAYWGKGLATAALSQFLEVVEVRPLYARVAKHNGRSVSVLQKCGFTVATEDFISAADGSRIEEFLMVLVA
jgi:RimJ/RimL family protein N-acetyltransferase